MHGASVAQLKLVCASLDECEGFNSEGWIKSRVSGKKRAPIDLYLKQVARAKVMEDSPADTAAGIFADHMTEYNKMEQELRMYPLVWCTHKWVWQVGGCGILFLDCVAVIFTRQT